MSERRNEVLFAAIMDVVSGLDLRTTLSSIVSAATAVSHAKYGALGVLGPDGAVADFVHVGMDENDVVAIGHTPRGRGILGLLITHPQTVRIADLMTHPASFGFPPGHPPMHSFLGVPVRVRGSVFGNLYLTEKQNEPEFTTEDEELVSSLAAAAGLAIENARMSQQIQQMAVYEDRNRIAQDLHDLVIQSLFATGMTLESIARKAAVPAEDAEKLRSAADELDKTIKQIRQSIYALTSMTDAVTLRRRVMHEVEAYASLLGTTPSITFEGAVDSLVNDGIAEQLIAVLRELLSNAMRHAQATSLSVSVQVEDSHLVLTVIDNGVGIAQTARRSGLENLRHRAESLGGVFTAEPGTTAGTVARWAIPVS